MRARVFDERLPGITKADQGGDEIIETHVVTHAERLGKLAKSVGRHHGAHKLKADQPGTSRCGHQLRANRYPNRLLPEDHAPRDDAEKSDDLPRRLGVDQRRKVIVQPGIPEKQLLEVGGQLAAPGPLTESKDALPE